MPEQQNDNSGAVGSDNISNLTQDLMEFNPDLTMPSANYYARRILEAEASENFIAMYSLLCDAIVTINKSAVITAKP